MPTRLHPRPLLVALLLAALFALPPAIASAANIPGGAADQYTEGIPQATGQRPSYEPGTGNVPPPTAGQLQAQGPRGAAAAALAKLTGPAPDNPADDDSGMGWLLILILVACLIGAAAIYARRRRTAATG